MTHHFTETWLFGKRYLWSKDGVGTWTLVRSDNPAPVVGWKNKSREEILSELRAALGMEER